MGAVKVIINKELKVAFNSLLIYIAYTAFLCVTGFVCWFSGKNIFSSGQASLSNLFNVFYWTLFFLIPALTMKSISEERKDGTFELLFSKPIKTWQLIMGKFFAILLQVVICLALTLPYYITIASLGNVDHAVGFCGYLGLILVCGCYISIGMFASSLTPNTIVAFFITFAIEIGFVVLFEFIAELWGSGFMAALFTYQDYDNSFPLAVLLGRTANGNASQDAVLILTRFSQESADWLISPCNICKFPQNFMSYPQPNNFVHRSFYSLRRFYLFFHFST